jgi:hypothetical protein
MTIDPATGLVQWQTPVVGAHKVVVGAIVNTMLWFPIGDREVWFILPS